MTRSQARPSTRTAWGWRLPRARASAESLAAHGDPGRAVSAKRWRAWRARRLAARRTWTLLVLPDARVTGVAPASAAACSALLARSRMGPSSARSWAWLMWPTRGSRASKWALGGWPVAW
jgi:hypothetical protein